MTKEEAYHYIDNLKWLKGYDNTVIGGKTVGEILDEINALLKEQEAQGWISVEDRLPDKKGRYLCACIDYDTSTYWIDILWHVSGQWWRRLSTRGTDKDYNDHVQYWMSLPSTKGLDT